MYISRYDIQETHFERTDPFTGAYWEEEGTILIYCACFVIGLIVLSGLCLVATAG